MTLEQAVESICADARFSTKGCHADYIRCVLSQLLKSNLPDEEWAYEGSPGEIESRLQDSEIPY